jgi:hypothetical protein
VSGWSRAAQEHMALTAMLLPAPRPAVLLLGFPNWCPPVETFDQWARRNRNTPNESKPSYIGRYRSDQKAVCIDRLSSDGNASLPLEGDAVGRSVAAVARQHGMPFVSLFDALAPLIAARHPLFSPPSKFTYDGIHGQRHILTLPCL